MGGPAQPMPQDMASPAQQLPPEAAMLQQVEQASAAQGQELGQAYAEQMMQGIDAAQSTEELINAFRGNEMPLDARRDELADYVGQGDADQTPESVLAMVQPVIMMTEEGAMNSGIGNLMQQLTGDIDMITEGGQPTDMGQGVGSLMMAGAPEAPAPQNFRQGGEVAFLQDASIPTATAPSGSFRQLSSSEIAKLLSGGDFNFGTEVQTQYESLLPLFKEIGLEGRAQQEQERKEMDEAQVLLSLARGGLRLAAGDRGTSGSLVSQIGSAFEPTAAEISAIAAQSQDRRDALRAQDQQLRLGALQAGISQAGAQQTLDLKRGIAAIDALISGGTAKDAVTVEFANGERQTYDLRTQFAEYQNAIDNLGGSVTDTKTTSDYGSGLTGQAQQRLNQPENIQSLVRGLLGERDQEALRALTDLASIQKFNEQTGYAERSVPVHLQPFVRLINDPTALQLFREQNADYKEGLLRDTENIANDIADGAASTGALFEHVTDRINDAAKIDIEAGTGIPSALTVTIDGVARSFADIFGVKIADTTISDAPEARRMLESAMQSVDRYVAGAPDESRLLQQQYERLVEQLPNASALQIDNDAKNKLKNYRNIIREDLKVLQETIRRSQLYRPSTLDATRRRLMQGIQLEKLLNALYQNYEFGPAGRDIPTGISGLTKEQAENIDVEALTRDVLEPLENPRATPTQIDFSEYIKEVSG
tara:strand:+ start:58 stop:2181 length:2124 start_codon:yes stop_codon:yes gene_type:complete